MSRSAISVPPSVLWQQTDDTMVLLDSEGGQYFELNDSAATAFKALLDTQNVAQTAAAVAAEYAVSEDQARADIEELLEALLAAGLVVSGQGD